MTPGLQRHTQSSHLMLMEALAEVTVSPVELLDAHTLEAAGVCVTVHRRELQVTAHLEAAVRVLHATAVLRPPVAHVLRAAELTAQDRTAAV